jgi:hypothetical protein
MTHPVYKLRRIKQDSVATLGKMFDESHQFLCATLESPWRANFSDNPKTKQNESSCIPEGKYLCRKFHGVKFQDVWELLDVPGRKNILIHQGNFPSNTHGCILVGKKHTYYQGFPIVNDSENALKTLRKILPDIFWLEIVCDGFVNSLCTFPADKLPEIKVLSA